MGNKKVAMSRPRVPHVAGGAFPPKVVLALCAWRFIEPDTDKCMIRALLTDRYMGMEKWNDAAIDRSRGIAATEYLRQTKPHESDVMVFIDSDMVFTLGDLDRVVALARLKHGIAVGAYPVRRGDTPWLAVRGIPGKEQIELGPQSAPTEVQYGSTGFMAIHRDVLATVARSVPLCTGSGGGQTFFPMFLPLVVEVQAGLHEYLSEDWSFCKRARDLGFGVWLEGRVDIGHIGSYTYRVRDIITGASSDEDRKAVVEDLAGYWEKDIYEIASMIKSPDMSDVWKKRADAWRDAIPSTPAEVDAYYRRQDIESVLDLAHLNSQPAYWDQVSPVVRLSGAVADFGGGIGSVSLALARRGCDVTYIDLRSPQRDFAEWRFRKHGFAGVSAADSLTECANLDAVFSVDTMEHIHPDHLPEIARQMFAAIRPGGEAWTINDFGRGTKDFLPMHYDDAGEFKAAMVAAGFAGGPVRWMKPYPDVL